MRIKFIKVEETLETRGNRPNPADRRVPRAVTGHVVTPSRGKAGVDDDPANPTELLKAMVRRNAKAADKRAKAAAAKQNASTEIFGNKIVEGFNDLLEGFSASGLEAAAIRRGAERVPGGYTIPRKPGKRGLPHELAVKKGKKEFALSLSRRRNGEKVVESPRNDSSTEILGNKIVEGFNRLLSEALKTPEELAAEKAKYASETVPKSIGKAKSRGPAAAKEIGKKVLKSVVKKVEPLTPRPGETPEETEQRGKRIASKRGLLASKLPGEVGVSRSDVFTNPRPPKK